MIMISKRDHESGLVYALDFVRVEFKLTSSIVLIAPDATKVRRVN